MVRMRQHRESRRQQTTGARVSTPADRPHNRSSKVVLQLDIFALQNVLLAEYKARVAASHHTTTFTWPSCSALEQWPE